MTENMLIAGAIGGGVLVILALIVLGFAQAHKSRMLTHSERMKALEMGHPLMDDPETAKIKARAVYLAAATSGGNKSLAIQCFSITGYTSGAGFFFAMMAGGSVAYAIASAAGAIGVTGMICGTILATKEFVPNPASAISKPIFDPEVV